MKSVVTATSNPCGVIAPAMILLAAISSATAQPQYEIIDLGTLGGARAVANGISENGIVVGQSQLPSSVAHAALWDPNGVIMDLGAPPGFIVGEAVAVNDAGQVAVVGHGNPQLDRAFLWEDGLWTEIPPFDGATDTYPGDINGAGQIVGWSYTPAVGDDYNGRAFLWEDGVMTDLGTLGGLGGVTQAYGINEAGQVVGRSETDPNAHILFRGNRAFIWQDGVMTDLGSLPGEEQSGAFEVNDRGDVVGESWRRDFPHFFVNARATLWRGGDDIVDLGLTPADPFLYPDGPCIFQFYYWTSNTARAVNNCGQVVGSARCVADHSFGRKAAFLWQDGVNYNLNFLTPPDSSLLLISAEDINDAGQIVGWGVNAAGHLRAFLLEPLTPPPCDELPGDLDGDGDVDLADLAMLLAAYDMCAGDSGYNPDADLDESGCVDLPDLATLLADYGAGAG